MFLFLKVFSKVWILEERIFEKTNPARIYGGIPETSEEISKRSARLTVGRTQA